MITVKKTLREADLNEVQRHEVNKMLEQGLEGGTVLSAFFTSEKVAKDVRDAAREAGYVANYSDHEEIKGVWRVKILYKELD